MGAFNDQYNALLQYIARQKWVDTNAVAWVGFSMGANRMLEFALQHPEQQPRLLVQLGGAGLPAEARSQKSEVSLQCRVLLIHGEQDEIFPMADTKRLAAVLQSNGVPAELKIISGASHRLGPERGVVFRGIGEYCLTHLASKAEIGRQKTEMGLVTSAATTWENYHSSAQWQAEAPALWLFWLPAAVWAGGWLVWGKFGRRVKFAGVTAGWKHCATLPATGASPPCITLKRHEIALRWLAVLLAMWALAETALHLVPPRFPVSDRTLGIARRFFVEPKERSGFEFLAAQPIWHGEKLKTLLTHIELASYNRQLINWQLDDQIYQDYVLSPVLDPSTNHYQLSTGLNWRRPLWEEFYPRIRRESSPEDAAEIVVRHLRERVTIVGGLPRGEAPGGTPGKPAGGDARAKTAALRREVPDIWLKQITDEDGFEIIYVAALRSVGVPARLDANRHAEFYDGNQWQSAPSPAVVSW